MTLQLFAHPFSSYCQKVLIAFYENNIPFEFRLLAPEQPQNEEQLAQLWPLKRMPVLVDNGRTVLESTTVIEYLDAFYPGAVRLIPTDASAAIDARMMDRVFDNYVMTPMQKFVFDKLRDEKNRDAQGVADARTLLDKSYRWLNEVMKNRVWAIGDNFSLADCAAAPSLFYADWAHPIDASLTHLREYRQRLLARPSVARAVDEARPYRAYFPLGAPDRD